MGNCITNNDEMQMQPTSNGREKKDDELIRFFVTGIKGVGKTTIINQLKCLCVDEPNTYKYYNVDNQEQWVRVQPTEVFPPHEKSKMRNTIRVNILEAFNNVIEKAHELGRVLQDEELAEFVLSTWSDMKSSGAGIYQDVPAYIGDMLSRLRLDKTIDDLLAHRNDYLDMRIDDGTLHFILDDANKKSFWRERMAQIFSDDYEVTTRDIPYSRRVTENQKKNHFRTRSFKIEFNDMGGQRSELIKLPDFLKRFLWGNGRTFVLYVASIADAFEMDSSERQRSKLERSARVLDLILSLPTVSECGIMIFFNKYDRYEEIVNYKLQSEAGRAELADRIGTHMKESDLMKLRRGTLRSEQARELIKQAIEGQFVDICKKRTKNEVYVHYTQAVVRELMKLIFNSVEENIYNSIIANASYIRVA